MRLIETPGELDTVRDSEELMRLRETNGDS